MTERRRSKKKAKRGQPRRTGKDRKPEATKPGGRAKRETPPPKARREPTPRAAASPRKPAAAKSLLWTVAHKELREVARDGRFWIIAASMALLLLVALAFGLGQSAAIAAERHAAQDTADDHFAEQDDKNPHVAAHYGSYVFKPHSALSFVDPGLEPFLGASVRIQAHERSSPEGARAQDRTSLARLGRMSVASVLQLLLPLLIIGLGFSAWTGERERGTMRLLATSGVRRRTLFLGKALGLAVALLGLLVPAMVVATIAIALSDAGGADPARALFLALAYLAYFAVFLFVTLAVSAFARSSRAALVALLGIWIVTSLVIPRVAVDVAAIAAPTPTPTEVASSIQKSLAEGLPGGPPREERVEAIIGERMAEEGFQDAEMLMAATDLTGVELQAEAQFENEVIDYHYDRLADAIERQENVLSWMGALAPPVALQSVSAAFAGTDYAHHRHFADAAEDHRRAFIDMLNRELTERGGADAWSYEADSETWARAPKFSYEPPNASWAVSRQAPSVLVLVVWLLASLGLAAYGANRTRIV